MPVVVHDQCTDCKHIEKSESDTESVCRAEQLFPEQCRRSDDNFGAVPEESVPEQFLTGQFCSEWFQPDQLLRPIHNNPVLSGGRTWQLGSRSICDQNRDRGLCKAVLRQPVCIWWNQPDEWCRLFRIYPGSICALWHYNRTKLQRPGSKRKRNFPVCDPAG